MLLKTRFKCTKDVWLYLTERSKYFTILTLFRGVSHGEPEEGAPPAHLRHLLREKEIDSGKKCSSSKSSPLAWTSSQKCLPHHCGHASGYSSIPSRHVRKVRAAARTWFLLPCTAGFASRNLWRSPRTSFQIKTTQKQCKLARRAMGHEHPAWMDGTSSWIRLHKQ